MAKELIVSVNGREKKIAIVEDDVVTEFYVERGDENQGIVGNIYKGRVMKVLPGMQSAFVDIGLERDSFLYVSDFLEDEEFEGVFTEERKETQQKLQRPPRPERRPTREAVAAPLEVEETEDDREGELQAAALRHIEEISEEPVMELDPELVEADALADDEVTSARVRRRQRLSYDAPEAEVMAAVKEIEEAQPKVVYEAVTDAPVSEPEEDDARARRRRRGGRRRRPEEVEATESTETVAPVKVAAKAKPAVKAAEIFEPTPYLASQQEDFERIIDDEAASHRSSAIEQFRTEEYITTMLDVEPTPEAHVGSLRAGTGHASDFERISDDADGQHHHHAKAKTEESHSSDDKEDRQMHAAHSSSETVEEPVLTDAEAQVREPRVHEEFATRRGGRGRRYRQRTVATDATGENDENDENDVTAPAAAAEAQEEEKAFAAPAAAAAPAAPLPRATTRAATASATPRATASATPRATATGAPPGSGNIGRPHRPVISDMLREGQEILVQIAKEPIAQKGARITSHIALPGRYIVYMPTVEHIGVSRKIGTDEERQRLRRTLHQLRAEDNIPGGFIVRTAAAGRTMEELRDDVQYLFRTSTELRRRSDRAKAPAIIHRDLDLVQRILRDQLSSDFTAIRVDNELEYERIVDFVNRFAPKLVRRVKLYTKDTPILEEYAVQAEIDKAVKPRVWLRSGGYIVINQTEALVAIDVNTGKFVGRSNRLEDTIVKTNLEAAREIARQIRLRDLGGIIVLDFIDMEERRNRVKVMQTLEQELRGDKSPSKVLQFNDFGLVAITRKRVKQSLERTLCMPCSYCGGGGMVKSAQTVCYEILTEARRVSKTSDDFNEAILRVHPEVSRALRSTERDVLTEIESYLGASLTIKSDPTVHQEQFDIALI